MPTPTPPTPPAPLDTLAQPQAGIVTRAQLLAAHWSPARIDRGVARGRLLRVGRGVYRASGAPWSRRAAQHTAILLVGEGVVLARWSAAELHGFVENRGGPLDVLAPHPHRQPADADGLVRLRTTRTLPPDERCEVHGLPATSGARTLLDLAGACSVGRLAELIAGAVRVGACSLDDLECVLQTHRNARGRSRLVSAVGMLADDGATSRSDVEVAALRALLEAGLPRPVVAFRIVDDGGRFLAEVDLAYPDARVAVEIDGFAWHSSPARKRRDEERQNRLVLAGWTVLRFSASEVRARPHLLVAAVRRALTAG